MGITSLQVCMDSSDWFQGTISEENAGIITDDCSSPMTITQSGEDNNNNSSNILTCSRPLLETRRLRPQHEQSLKCPRCDSTHTKFCYYNNYSLSQPRYFCKTCRRYWTKGGTLRNIPVGGGCRKNNKKVSSSSKKTPPSSSSSPPSSSSSPALLLNHATSALLSSSYNMNNNNNNTNQIGGYNNSDHYSTAGLHLAFSDQLQFSSLGFFNHNNNNNNNLLLDHNPAPIDFMENKYGSLVGDFVGNFNGEDFCGMNNGGNFNGGASSSMHGYGNSGGAPAMILESCQRLMMPYDDNLDQDRAVDVKPSGSKILSLEWHDNQHHQQAGYNFGGLGSWTGLMNGYGSSATNPLV